MPKIYEEFDDEAKAVLQQVMEAYHSRLVGLGARVRGVFGKKFDAEDQLVPYLKHRGVKAMAVVKTISVARKVFLEHDAEIEVDFAIWDGLTNDQRKSLIDHELEHLVPLVDREGTPKYDDRNNIILKCRPHDWDDGGFITNIERFGANSVDYQLANAAGEAATNALTRYLQAIDQASTSTAATLAASSS